MSRQDKINAERLQKQAEEAGKVARQLAEQSRDWAGPRVDAARDWAGPKVDAAREWASPRVEQALRSGVQTAAPKVAEYADRSRGAVDAAHDKLTGTVIPRVVEAMENAAKAATESADGLHDRAGSALEAASDAAAKQTKGGSKVGKTIGWVLAGAAVAGAGVLIWKRTQPTEDPWAEEYWDDAPAAAPIADSPASAERAKHAATPADSPDEAVSAASGEDDAPVETAADGALDTNPETADIVDEVPGVAADPAETKVDPAEDKKD